MSPKRISSANWNPNYVRKLLIGMANTPIQESGGKWSQAEMEALCERMAITSKIFQWLLKGPESTIHKGKKRLVKKSGNKKTSSPHVNHRWKSSEKKKGQGTHLDENISESKLSPDVNLRSSDVVSAVANVQFDLSEWYTQEDLIALDI